MKFWLGKLGGMYTQATQRDGSNIVSLAGVSSCASHPNFTGVLGVSGLDETCFTGT